MSVTTVSAEEFARDLAEAKSATSKGPVVVTDEGEPAFALLSIEDYHRLTQLESRSLLQVMESIPGGDFEFEPPKLADNMGFKFVEFE